MTTETRQSTVTDEEIKQLAAEKISQIYVPASAYRLQLNHAFPFSEAVKWIPYFRGMGVDALYCSPYFKSAPGSMHGYDVTDHTQINPEIGSEEDFETFVRAAEKHSLKQILDVVPNHMGISKGHNKLWQDVLENGPSSEYAKFFDIDWDPVKKELKNKILIPLLGGHYGRVLENQELELRFEGGEFFIRYYEHRLPVAPTTYPLILEYGVAELESTLGKNDPDLMEYLSIVTALRNLPAHTETDPEKIRERSREKDIAKRRLLVLYEKSPAVREFIDARVRILNGTKGEPASFDLLDQLLHNQAYRVAYWEVAAEEINYRRFFDIHELAALRVEVPEVFDHHHSLVYKLILEGKAHGLRIDHPDGLYNPPEYFRKIQQTHLTSAVARELFERFDVKEEAREELKAKVSKVVAENFGSAKSVYVVAEKILDRKENLPENWNVHGTVGYDFMNALNGVFIDQTKETAFQEIYQGFIHSPVDFGQILYEKKRFFTLINMASEINTLGSKLDQISEKNRHYRDFTRYDLTAAIREVIACFPVYRTYISPEDREVSARDAQYIRIALEKAKRKNRELNPKIYDFLRDILLLKVGGVDAEEERLYRDFVFRFQQLTGPIMAKGMEDTTFYVYNRFVSLNEVGGYPDHFGVSKADFHRQNQDRNQRWPAGLLATTTHDTKRSEDIRMRLNYLSEIPEDWKAQVVKWSIANEKHKTEIDGTLYPDRNLEYFIYQTLVGAWPDESMPVSGYEKFTERIRQYVLKSMREAKTETNWIHPNPDYETAVARFVDAVLERRDDNWFLEVFLPFQKKVASFGHLNSLSATVLKLGSPGVVDLYQGCELWNYSLVDPDNRREVDFAKRQTFLDELEWHLESGRPLDSIASELYREKADGRIKMYLLWRGLRFRRQYRELFIGSDYIPLRTNGGKDRNLVAFLRKRNGESVVTIAGRFFSDLLKNGHASPVGNEIWEESAIYLPSGFKAERMQDVFTGKIVKVRQTGEGPAVLARDAFQVLSVSMLTNARIE